MINTLKLVKVHVPRYLKHILFWLFILFIFTVLPGIYSKDLKSTVLVNIVYLPIDIIATYVLLYKILVPFIKKGDTFRFILGLVNLYVITIALSIVINYTLVPLLGLVKNNDPLLQQAHNSFLILSTIFGLAVTLKLINIYGDIKIKKVELENKNIKSELSLLKSQINPHFLFNSLNNIDELIYENKERASGALHKLSGIMRYMLKESVVSTQMLANEIKFIKDYIELAKLTFASRDFIDFKIKGDIPNKKIAPLLFISLVENTIKHGKKNVAPPGIWIEFRIFTSYIELRTKNYISTHRLKNEVGGMGLNNLQRRLDLIYHGNYILDIDQDENMFATRLKIIFDRKT